MSCPSLLRMRYQDILQFAEKRKLTTLSKTNKAVAVFLEHLKNAMFDITSSPRPRPRSDHINPDRRTGVRQRDGVYLQQHKPYGDNDDQTVRTVQIHHDIRAGLPPFTGCYETQFRLSLILVVCVVIVCKIAIRIISIASRGTYEAVHQRTYTRNAGSL